MMNRFKIIITLLFIFEHSFGKLKIDYTLAVSYIFDSNFTRNVDGTLGHSVVPEIEGRLYFPVKIPLYLGAALKYDHYKRKRDHDKRERDYDDNSPFITTEWGTVFDTKRFSLALEAGGVYYMGFGYDPKTLESEAEEVWLGVIRELDFSSGLKFKKKNHSFGMSVKYELWDYGENDKGETEDKTGFMIELNPNYRVKIKNKNRKKIGLRAFEIGFVYEYRSAYDIKNEFNRVKLPLETRFRFFSITLENEIEFIRKIYVEEREESSSGDMIIPAWNGLSVENFISIPLVSDLSLITGGKLRFRNSNWDNFQYDRHTFYLLLEWDSSVNRGD